LAVTLQIERDEALVLFSLLADFYEQKCLDVPSSAERLALVRLQAALEKVLVEPFQADYLTLLADAKNHLSAQFGES